MDSGPRVSPDGRTVFYAKGEGETTTLLRIPAQGGAEQEVVRGMHRYSFAVSARGIYYVAMDVGVSLRFLDLVSNKTTELLKAEERADLGLAVSSDGRHLLFSKIDQFESDLMLVENFR